MGGIDFVVPVGTDQQQMLHIRPCQQILEQIERCRVEPLQIVEEQGERMFRPCEHADKSAEHQLKAALRLLRWELGDRWLFTYDVLQFWDEIHHEQSIRIDCLKQRIPPSAQFRFGLTQEWTDKALKRLCQRGIRNVALVLVELA